MHDGDDVLDGDGEPRLRFELGRGLPCPISVGGDGRELVVILDEGAVVDETLVRAINDLIDPDRR
jgi:hypothetical protein